MMEVDTYWLDKALDLQKTVDMLTAEVNQLKKQSKQSINSNCGPYHSRSRCGHGRFGYLGCRVDFKNLAMKALFLILILITASCSEEDMHPKCAASENQCNNLLRLMDQANTAQEKERYRQKYLTEKHYLDECLRSN